MQGLELVVEGISLVISSDLSELFTKKIYVKK